MAQIHNLPTLPIFPNIIKQIEATMRWLPKLDDDCAWLATIHHQLATKASTPQPAERIYRPVRYLDV